MVSDHLIIYCPAVARNVSLYSPPFNRLSSDKEFGGGEHHASVSGDAFKFWPPNGASEAQEAQGNHCRCNRLKEMPKTFEVSLT